MPLHPQLQAAKMVKAHNLKNYAEIGIFQGDTVSAVAKVIPDGGNIYLFDYEDAVNKVSERIKKEQGSRVNVIKKPNSKKTGDSYNWSLMRMLQSGGTPFDYVYLDGAHTFNIDALAFLLVDKLLRVGGLLEFDDYKYSFANTLARDQLWVKQGKRAPEFAKARADATRAIQTEEQMAEFQVELIVNLLVRPGGRYTEVSKNRLFKKVK